LPPIAATFREVPRRTWSGRGGRADVARDAELADTPSDTAERPAGEPVAGEPVE